MSEAWGIMVAKKKRIPASKTATNQIGKLTPRFNFILNPYGHTRLSSCPLCQRPTHMRKFALLIYIEKWGLLALGKTCRYCTPCELIMAHRDELEDELVRSLESRAPEVIGNPYTVFGTVDKQRWKESLGRCTDRLSDALEYAADFKKVFNLKIQGGWQPAKKSRRITPLRGGATD